MYGMTVMRSIIQEKTTRIIEVLLSAANPFQIMAGKILGLGSVSFTQYLIWALFGMILLVFGAQVMPVSAEAFSFSPMILFYFVLFYVLGYFLFASMYAGVGAVTNNDQEAQQLATPITFMLIIPIILISFMVKNPDSTVVQVLSYIPFFSPIIMFARINLASPPLIEIWASIIILIITIIFMIWIVSKIFRIGILMYGKRPTLPEIAKWLRQ
jgi:ABC-2 type transport system permease protein